jgi:hypothetical protein
MHKRLALHLLTISMLLASLFPNGNGLLMPFSPLPVRAASSDAWWDPAWPYRIPVNVSDSGVAQATINFTTAFSTLGLNAALLDLRSLRVVPYTGGAAGSPLAYAESYSHMLENAESPQIGWQSSGVYWEGNDSQTVLQADASRYSQGAGSLKATITNLPGGYDYPGVQFEIASSDSRKDWHNYETFIYDIWPEVNASARDQAPDLYWYKLYNTTGCPSGSITQGGPALALNRWNYASVSLKPFDTCTTPNFTNINRMEFHTRDNASVSGRSGLWDDGDQLTLWFDNLRLVDQDTGAIRWQTNGAARYYIYFDTLSHEGHPQPALASLGAATLTGTPDGPEAGGYFYQVSGASPGSLSIWSAPPVEKILKTQTAPIATALLQIQAAQDEFEPFQLVVRDPTTQTLNVSVSDFVHSNGTDKILAGNTTLHRVDYVNITQLSDSTGRLGSWPDPLYPVTLGSGVSFPANSNQPLWFTVHVPRSAPPGVYHATVTVGSASVPVELQVWNFALPKAIHLKGEWGFGWSDVVERYKGTIGVSVQSGYWTLVDALYQDFANHRLTPKGVGWPAGLNYPGGVEYDCNGKLDPVVWGVWGFDSLAKKYLQGTELDNGVGFPSFQIKGPSDNYPPESRPSSFCGQARGSEPPGNTAYNTKWFQYWKAVSDYLGSTSDYAAKGYYHIVNEPQTFADYDIVAYLAKQTKANAPNVRILVSEQVEPAIYNNAKYPGAKIDIWMPTISNYEVEKSHDRQLNYGEEVWWYFLYGDRPPLPNPTVIDRPGIEARITPWLAWMERVQGLLYYSTTDWSPDPWTNPWINDGNGDGFMFYPPKDTTIAYNAGVAQSNRLVPSLRWELMREGMEDYEYLWLLNQGDPQIGVTNAADTLAGQFIASRTLFSHVPTDLYATRAAIAAQLTGPQASITVSRSTVKEGGTFDYILTYNAGDAAHSVTITDDVPAGTTVVSVGASKSPVPTRTGQHVSWTVSLAAQEEVTLTITAQGTTPGLVTNTATFTGPQVLTARTSVLIYRQQLFLPILRR